MEFEEVNNLIKVGHVDPGAMPSSSLPWHPAFGVAPHTATPGTSGTYYMTTSTTHPTQIPAKDYIIIITIIIDDDDKSQF